MNPQLIAVACGLLATCKIFAATPPETVALASGAESEFFSELPVVLSVSRLSQTLHDVPGAVTLIDRQMIRQSGARDLAELLRFVPGFHVAISSSGVPVASYHGMTSDVPRGMQVLVDGRSLHSPVTAGVPWDLIEVPLAEIERIEVLRGSNSAAYGANAFMGVVNVITRDPSQTHGVEVSTAGGNQGINDWYGRLGGGVAGFNYRLSAEETKDEGLSSFFDDRRSRRLNFRGDAELGLNDSLNFALGQMRVELGTGYGPTTTSAQAKGRRPHRFVVSESTFGQLNWRHSFSESTDLQLRYGRSDQRIEDAFRITEGPFSVFQDEGVHALRDDIELQQTVVWSNDLRTVVGAGYRQDAVSGARTFGAGVVREQMLSRLFGHLEWRFAPKWALNLGGTHEWDSVSGDADSPKIMLNYHFTPTQTLKLGYTRANRLPTLFESYANQNLFNTTNTLPGALLDVGTRSSGRVGPEKVIQQEIVYFGEFNQLGLTADIRGFDEKLSGWIMGLPLRLTPPGCALAESNCGDFDDMFNAFDARIRGWESQLTWRPRAGTEAILTYADVTIHSSRAISAPSVNAQRFLDLGEIYLRRSTPGETWSIILSQTLPGNLLLSVAWYDVAGFKWTRGTELDAYQRLDWRLAYPFSMGGKGKGEIAYTARGDGGRHGEWGTKSSPDVGNEWVYPRHFISLRLDF